MIVLQTVVIVVVISSFAQCEDPIVTTALGKVQGLYGTTRGGREFVQFLGIPYAKPPTGTRRFKNPEYPDKWDNVLNATKECTECIQQLMLSEEDATTVSGSEDCLCINVFTPSITTSTRLPVIVWIHGGNYLGSSSTTRLYDADLLLDRDIVLVSFNFRVGILGFLTTGDSVIPGNYGMKDQAFAFKWVRDNIAHFGGDPDSVTLFGENSGASSVSLHQYSPLSKGLFHKAIQSSGSVLSPGSIERAEVMKGRSSVAIRIVGCSDTESAALLECLQALPAATLVNTTHTFKTDDISSKTIWAPTVEAIGTEDAFLTEDPLGMVETATLPLLTGLNYAEGGYVSVPLVGSDAEEKFARWNAEYDTLTPTLLQINNTDLDRPVVTEAIRKYYFGSDSDAITPDQLQQITNLFGDIGFNIGILDEAEIRTGLTYLYYYNYNKTFSLCPILILGTATPYVGACHFDDLTNVFPILGYAPVYNTSDPDYLLSVQVVDMWTNFARNADPSTSEISWRPVKRDAFEYLDITNSGITMKSNLLAERRAFWKSLSSLNAPSTSEISWRPVKKDAFEYLDITNSGITMKSNLLAERRAFWKSLSSLK